MQSLVLSYVELGNSYECPELHEDGGPIGNVPGSHGLCIHSHLAEPVPLS